MPNRLLHNGFDDVVIDYKLATDGLQPHVHGLDSVLEVEGLQDELIEESSKGLCYLSYF